MEKKKVLRVGVYVVGLLILALGIVLNTKAGLGVSPIISVAYCVSEIMGVNFGDVTFAWYTVFILIEMIIHIGIVDKKKLRMVLVQDALQIVLSIVFTRFVNLFSALFPTAEQLAPGNLWVKIAVLVIALVLTGCGAAMSLDVRIIPNPGDGIVQALSDLTKKKIGLMKNCVDISCVCLSSLLGLLIAHRLIGVGVGTAIAMIVVGRVVAVFNHYCLDWINSTK